MELKAQQFRTQLEQYQTALKHLEVYAPHDGVLQYEQNWRGEKPRIGQSMWPGQKLAKLPELNALQAKIFVLESEAGIIETGDRAEVRMDARPDKVFSGEVVKKDSIAKPIRSGNPVKYFEITVSITAPDSNIVQPGNKLTAVIYGTQKQDILTVPLQSVFSEGDGSFVYVLSAGKLEKRPVTLGHKSFAEVEVITGLAAGDEVALFKPVL